MASASAQPLARGTFRTTLSGVGRPGPIEERLGRRLIRIVRPDSKEGIHLLRSGCVTFLGPEGQPLGCADLEAARRLLQRRLRERLSPSSGSEHAEIVRDGLSRLKRGDARVGRA
ncbi:MAG TPA: hypothetical protein VFV19_03970 [Candidatus Polarisedimenticolaceae bacterium]|nr:hypothetical protein [Candidatus Polarisedimenticolaceae bacterium]